MHLENGKLIPSISKQLKEVPRLSLIKYHKIRSVDYWVAHRLVKCDLQVFSVTQWNDHEAVSPWL